MKTNQIAAISVLTILIVSQASCCDMLVDIGEELAGYAKKTGTAEVPVAEKTFAATAMAATQAPPTPDQNCDGYRAVSVENVFEKDETDTSGRICIYKIYVSNNSNQEVVVAVHLLMFKIDQTMAPRGPEWSAGYIIDPGDTWQWWAFLNYPSDPNTQDTYSIVNRIAVINRNCLPRYFSNLGVETYGPYARDVQVHCTS